MRAVPETEPPFFLYYPLPEGEVAGRSPVGEGEAGLSERIPRSPPSQLRRDQAKRRIDVFNDQPRRQPQRPDTVLSHPSITGSVPHHLLFPLVNASIYLDRQLGGVAIEVEDVGAKRVLPSEVEALESLGSDRPPEGSL